MPEAGIEHRLKVGKVLTKVDSSEWKITNRMVDVDTEEVLYRLREADQKGAFQETEILTESQISRSFDVDDDLPDSDGPTVSDAYRFVRPIDGHPIPFDQDMIDRVWKRFDDPAKGDPPSVDEAHEDYARTIAEWGDWNVFRPVYPFGSGDIVFWNRASNEAFQIDDSEGSWHSMVNLFAEIVDAEGDCRDADYSGGLTQAGGRKQRCSECGSWWVVG